MTDKPILPGAREAYERAQHAEMDYGELDAIEIISDFARAYAEEIGKAWQDYDDARTAWEQHRIEDGCDHGEYERLKMVFLNARSKLDNLKALAGRKE